MADHLGEVSTHCHSVRHAVRFSTAAISIPTGRAWRDGSLTLFGEDGVAATFACASLCAVSAGGEAFTVTIGDGAGNERGSFTVDGIVTGFPSGADCYLFRRSADGFWRGVTVASGYRTVVLRSFACDPL